MTKNEREPRFRRFCATWNSKTLDDLEQEPLQHWARYYLIGEETAPKTGRVHLQCVFYTRDQMTWSGVCRKLPGAHVEVCQGTLEQNDAYCGKGGKFIEWGLAPGQGKRRDLDYTRQAVANGRMTDVIDHGNLQQIRVAQIWQQYNAPKRDKKNPVYVTWLWGEPGVGKSWRVEDMIGEQPFFRKASGKWWCGYSSEDIVVMDDFSLEDFAEKDLLRWWDRYSCRVETKGGSIELNATQFYVTTNYDPVCTFGTCTWAKQFIRRITKVINLGTRSGDQKSGG